MTAFDKLRDCVAGLRLVAVPTWVIDAETIAIVWANDAAADLWRAASPDELCARDIKAGAPERVLQRTEDIIARVRAGERVREDWAFYPKGHPVVVDLHLSGVTLDDGHFGLLNQALPLAEERVVGEFQRVLAIARHTSLVAFLVGRGGEVLARNTAALTCFDEQPSWLACLRDGDEASALLGRVLAGEAIDAVVAVATASGPRWHRLTGAPLRDPITGELAALLEHRDETGRIEAEQLAARRGLRVDSLRAALETVIAQRREIVELSAPLLEVGDATLAVPVIGHLDDEQGEALLSKLLAAVVQRGARRVIVDLTGVVDVDDAGARRLEKLLRGLKLLGATPVISGVPPGLALASLGSELAQELAKVTIVRTLAAGIEGATSPTTRRRPG
ncbi:MAG: STAS domain-containing protein [Nannocystaceae bacterium]